jgi:hypothetical protein
MESTQDTILLDEIARNTRTISHPKFGEVRLARPTPRKERMIAEVRGREYHKFLRDESILSRAQLEEIAVRRGIWTEEKGNRLKELQTETGRLMGALDALGYQSLDTVTDAYGEVYARTLGLFEDNEEITRVVDLYFDLDLEPVHADRKKITEAANTTEVDDALDEADELRGQLLLLRSLTTARAEMNKLQFEQAVVFRDSLESRTDRAEELAQIYFCTADAITNKPLWPTYDDIWDTDPEDLDMLIQELFYFMNGITPEFQEILAKHGFTRRVRDIKDQLEDSPAHPTPNSDGEPAEKTLEDSSELETAST